MATSDQYAQWIVANADKKGTPEFDTVSAAYKDSRQNQEATKHQDYSGDVQSGAMTALQGAGLGFMDELAGVGGAIAGKAFNLAGLGDNKTFAEDYRTIRDKYRGDVAQFAKDNPKSAFGLQVAGALPTALGSAPLSAVSRAGMLPTAINAAKVGGVYGAAGGLGSSESQDIGGMLADTAKGAALGGVTAGALQPIGTAIGAVGSNVAQRFNNSSATDAARVKLAEALSRDARGDADPFLQAQARMGKLGPEATIADTAGESTRGLLDTLATLPGKTKSAISNLIHERQATRSGRMIESADEALGTQGKNASQFTKDLIDTRSREAAPLYDQVRGAPVLVDDEVSSLLQATAPFHSEAEKLATLKGTPLNLDKVQSGDQIPLAYLDMLKQTLFDAADAAKRTGNKQLGRAVDDLRTRLTNKLDEASPKDAMGNSIYKQARDTFAGHSETLGAVDLGRSALREGADSIRDMTNGMGQSEIDAFRVGVLQSLRDKLGSQSGQTQMMKMWQEPNTSSRLKEIFGNDYRKFAADVAREARLKQLDAVGKGSQTAARQFAAGDLDALPTGEIGQALANAKTGNIAGLVGSATSAWNRVQMPEKTRNALGELMMAKGTKGQAELNALNEFIAQRMNKNASLKGSIAAELGYQTGRQ